MTYEISVPSLPSTILLVPDEEADEARKARGQSGRVWTFSEILEMRARNTTTEEAVKLAEMRMMFDAGPSMFKGTPAQVQKPMAF